MIVTRRPDLEEVLLARLAASFDGPLPEYTCPAEEVRGDEIHLSDLLSPRQSVFKRIMPEPTDTKSAQLFMYGRGFEVEFIRRSGLRSTNQQFYQYRDQKISFRPDFDDWPGVFDGPIELKWRRANLAEAGQEVTEYHNYLAQLRGYCALKEGWEDGLLIVNTPRQGQAAGNYLASTQPATAVYEVNFMLPELVSWQQELLRRADAFVRRSIKDLPLCYDFLCGGQKVIKESFCQECNTELKGQWAAKHTSTKKGAGHTVTSPEFKYEPRCPWYEFCRPQDTDPSRGAR